MEYYTKRNGKDKGIRPKKGTIFAAINKKHHDFQRGPGSSGQGVKGDTTGLIGDLEPEDDDSYAKFGLTDAMVSGGGIIVLWCSSSKYYYQYY